MTYVISGPEYLITSMRHSSPLSPSCHGWLCGAGIAIRSSWLGLTHRVPLEIYLRQKKEQDKNLYFTAFSFFFFFTLCVFIKSHHFHSLSYSDILGNLWFHLIQHFISCIRVKSKVTQYVNYSRYILSWILSHFIIAIY